MLIEILAFSFTKMRLKVSSAKRRPFCLGLNVLTGISGVVLGLVSLTVNMNNFPPNHRGLVAGTMGASWWFGSAITAAIYNSYYLSSSVGNFFLFVGILYFVTCALCMWLVRRLPVGPDREECQALTTDKSMDSHVSQIADTEPLVQRFGLDMLCNMNFHLLLWGYVLMGSVQLAFLTNITIFTESYELTEYNFILTVGGPLCACAVKFLVPCISDYTVTYFPRIWYVLATTLVQAVIIFACIFVGNDHSLFLTTAFVVYMANGIAWGVLPPVVSEYFGMCHFSRNWGFFMLVESLFLFVILAILGLLYDDQIRLINSHECLGLRCFQGFYILATILSALAVIAYAALCIKEIKVKTTPGKVLQ